MSWCECPNCHEGTGWAQPNGKTRCIPCGYGITPQLDRLRTPEESRKAAEFLSGRKWK